MKSKTKQKILVLTLALFFLVVPMLAMNAAHAQSATTATFTAAKDGTSGATTSWTANYGTTVKVDFYANNVNPGYGTGSDDGSLWGVTANTVTWNPAVLQLTSVVQGTWISDSTAGDTSNPDVTTPAGQTYYVIGTSSGAFDNGRGQINGGVGLTNAAAVPDQYADNSGAIFTLWFTVVGYGVSTINFGGVSAYGYSGAPAQTETVPSATVTVGAPTTATTLNLTPISGATEGSATAITGTLMTTSSSAPLVGETVVIWANYVDSSGALHTFSTTTTTTTGGVFTYSWTPATTYNYEVYVQFAGDSATNVASISAQTVFVSTFVSPEYAWGALIALFAAFAGFIAFAAVKKNIHIPSFSKRI